jgi:hypothetical protein
MPRAGHKCKKKDNLLARKEDLLSFQRKSAFPNRGKALFVLVSKLKIFNHIAKRIIKTDEFSRRAFCRNPD